MSSSHQFPFCSFQGLFLPLAGFLAKRRFPHFLLILAAALATPSAAHSIDTEYDPKILDPHHADGAPYGGFSRATRQRLAALPLVLKESSLIESDDNRHYSIRDATGQLYACRLYPENELDPESLQESMFAAPRLLVQQQPSPTVSSNEDSTSTGAVAAATKEKQVATTARSAPRTRVVQQTPHVARKTQPATTDTTTSSTSSSSSSTTTASTSKGTTTTSSATSTTTPGGTGTGSAAATTASNGAQLVGGDDSSSSGTMLAGDEEDTEKDPIDTAALLQSFRSQLARMCGQIHKGYWSYEWCFEDDITQFHLEHHKKLNTLTVEQATSLGSFVRRIVQTTDLETPNEWMDDATDDDRHGEVARIVDVHTNGSPCGGDDSDATTRNSFIHYQCCSERVIQKMKSMMHRDGSQIKTKAVAGILHVVEEPTCTYNMTVCTPLLCGSREQTTEERTLEAAIRETAAQLLPELLGTTTATPPIDPNASILDILDQSLTHVRLQTNPNGGWWTYELNHGSSVQQYHEVAAIRQGANGGYSTTGTVRESEHILGVFDPASTQGLTKATEWQYVVNVTSGGGAGADDTSWGEGNGAYYAVEYTGGTVCDDADVTEHGITAMERSTTVRYYCGEMYDFDIREDTTCHYVVDVKVPGLCVHPLFQAPVVHQQIMKCLPVSDATEMDLAATAGSLVERIEI